jgi:hypothetical protein
MYDIQHCFIRRPSDSIVSEDAGIEPRTVATTASLIYRLKSHPQYKHVHKEYLGKPIVGCRYGRGVGGGGGETVWQSWVFGGGRGGGDEE